MAKRGNLQLVDKESGVDKQKALETALSNIERSFGKGSVMRMGDAGAARDIDAVSTGSLTLDVALGIGGLPRGRVIEIYGPESSGKTTLTLHCVAESQKAGGTAAFIDAEHALDPQYAGKLGVNVDDLLVSQPDTGEQALEIADMLVRSNAVDIVVIDAVIGRVGEHADRSGMRDPEILARGAAGPVDVAIGLDDRRVRPGVGNFLFDREHVFVVDRIADRRADAVTQVVRQRHRRFAGEDTAIGLPDGIVSNARAVDEITELRELLGGRPVRRKQAYRLAVVACAFHVIL